MSWTTMTTIFFQTESWATLLSIFTVFFLRSSKTECSTKRCASGDSARWSRGTVDVKHCEVLYDRLGVSSKTLFQTCRDIRDMFWIHPFRVKKCIGHARFLCEVQGHRILKLHADLHQDCLFMPLRGKTCPHRGTKTSHNTRKKGKMSRPAFRPIPWSLLLCVFSSGSAFAMFDACCKAPDCAHCLKQTFCIWLHKERIYSMFAPLQTVNTFIEYYVRPCIKCQNWTIRCCLHSLVLAPAKREWYLQCFFKTWAQQAQQAARCCSILSPAASKPTS